jgi:probable phosphoglycerate mutase
MIVYLIRHGETTGDVENRYGGTYDDHMTERGKASARDLAEKLADKKIEKIYSSPYHRAFETAEIISEKLNLTPEKVEDLRERNAYGILSGLNKQDAAKKFPKETTDAKDYRKTVRGAEDYTDFTKRFMAALDDLARTEFAAIAVVTHGGPIRMVFREILNFDEVEVGDCAFGVLENIDSDWVLLNCDGIEKRESKLRKEMKGAKK